MGNTHSAEAYIVKRYRLWHDWKTRYDYKHAKGARIADILHRTGGLAPLALELGVGPGGVASALSRQGMKIIGMDLSPDALVRAQSHCQGENVTLMQASGFSLPLHDQSLSLIYSSQVLHLFDSSDRLQIMREVFRVLRPAGRFVFDMKNVSSHPMRFARSSPERRRRNFPAQNEIKSLLQQAGFSTVAVLPGVLPLIRLAKVPNLAVCRAVAHTTFFVARRPV